jgi:hypothetical protein
LIERIQKAEVRKDLNVDNPVQAKRSSGIDEISLPSTPKWVELLTEFGGEGGFQYTQESKLANGYICQK